MTAVRPPFTQRMKIRLLAIMVLTGELLIRMTCRFSKEAFIDPAEYPWTNVLEDKWSVVRSELDTLLANPDDIPAFHEVSPEQEVLGVDRNWKTHIFYVFGQKIESNCRSCPKTTELLGHIPQLSTAMFSILEPQRSIPEHRGVYKGLLRYHLGLMVNSGEEDLSITVNGIRRGWQEGKTLILDDSFSHSVTNNSDGIRVVLFVDFVRPLPWPVSSYNRFIIWLIARSHLAQEPVNRLTDRATGA